MWISCQFLRTLRIQLKREKKKTVQNYCFGFTVTPNNCANSCENIFYLGTHAGMPVTRTLFLDSFFQQLFSTVSCKCQWSTVLRHFWCKFFSATFFSMRFVVVVVLKCYVCFIIVTVRFSIRFTLDNSKISFFFVHVFNHIWHASNEIFKFAFKWVLNSFTLHHFESTNTHWKW